MYQNNMAQHQYQQMAVHTAGPEKLLLMLYDGAIKFLKGAIKGLTEQNYEDANNYLLKTQDIINELMITLNMDYEISKQLWSLYDYFLNRLIEANSSKDITAAEEVLSFLTELRDTWAQAALKTKKQTSVG